jgi:hypothetical protein
MKGVQFKIAVIARDRRHRTESEKQELLKLYANLG